MKIPVRLLPVVQCIKRAGGGESEATEGEGTVARRWRRIEANVCAPEVSISTKAVTMPYLRVSR